MRKALLLAAGIASLLAFVAAGCGGGGGGSALTKDEWVSRVNEICDAFNQKQDEIGEPDSIEELSSKGQEILDEFENAIDEVKGLTPPDEIADQVDSFIELAEQQTDLIQQLIDAAEDNDTERIQELGNELEPLDTQSDEVANELGVTTCAED